MLDFVFAVKAAHQEINRRFTEVLRPLAVTVVQAEAVLVLADSPPLSVKELGGRLLAEAGNPSRLVDRLVTAGLVRREPAERDRRHVRVTLTPRGRDLAAGIRAAREPLLAWGRQTLDGQGLDVATAVLRRVVASGVAEIAEPG